jgi:hypothetical protein
MHEVGLARHLEGIPGLGWLRRELWMGQSSLRSTARREEGGETMHGTVPGLWKPVRDE